jgi:hypothetical protein
MRRIYLRILVVFTSAITAQTSCAATTAESLYAACSYLNQVVAGVSVSAAAMQKVQFCIGFVEAGTDGMLLGALLGANVVAGSDPYAQLRKAGVPYACAPTSLTNIDRVRLFLRYYENQTTDGKQSAASTENAINSLMNSVAQTYPCK